jgi:predicted deacylase
MDALKQGADALFILLGAIMVLAMHAGFAFLELGTVRKKNQVNALVKILVDFAVSTIAYFLVGYGVAYGALLRQRRPSCRQERLRAGEVLLPADLRGGDPGHHLRRHRRARQVLAAADRHRVIVGLVYPLFEGIAWNQRVRHPGLDQVATSARSSTTSPARSSCMRWAAGSRCRPCCCWARARNRYRKDGRISAHPPSNIPFLALGAWILTVGWFGFNVMSAQTHRQDERPGGRQLADGDGRRHADRLRMGRNDPGFVYNGPLAGLVAVCAGSDLMHPLGALVTGASPARSSSDVHAGAEPLEDRRRAGRVAAARPVRRLGRHRGRHLRQQGAGRLGGVSVGAAHRHVIPLPDSPMTQSPPALEVLPRDLSAYREGNVGIDYVHRFESGKPGPHVLINALTHGNEICGMVAATHLLDNNVRPKIGTLTVAFANIDAYESFKEESPYDSRQIVHNLNRIWSPEWLDGAEDSPELRRARMLRPVVDAADHILDIHSTSQPVVPFWVYPAFERNAEVALAIGRPSVHLVMPDGLGSGTPLIQYGSHGGPDGKGVAMVVECGQHFLRSASELATAVTYDFLAYFGLVDKDPATPAPEPQRRFQLLQTMSSSRKTSPSCAR